VKHILIMALVACPNLLCAQVHDVQKGDDLAVAAFQLVTATTCLANYEDADLFEVVLESFADAMEAEMPDVTPEQLEEEITQIRQRAYATKPDTDADIDKIWKALCNGLNQKFLPR
jgi:hypothetical protein